MNKNWEIPSVKAIANERIRAGYLPRPNRDWREINLLATTYKMSKKNSLSLLRESKLLSSKKKYHRALFLALIGLEEIGKCFLLFEAMYILSSPKLTKMGRRKINSLKRKIARSHHIKFKQIFDFVYRHQLGMEARTQSMAKFLENLRQALLYVDVDFQKGAVSLPEQIPDMDSRWKETFDLARRLHRWIKPQFESVFSFMRVLDHQMKKILKANEKR